MFSVIVTGIATPSACYRSPKPQSCPKWLGEGAKRLLDPGSKVLLHWCKRELHRCKTGFRWCKRLLGDLCSLGPKHLLHPLLTTLGTFEVSGPCSRHSGSQHRKFYSIILLVGSGQEVCFCPSRPDPVRNAREQDGARTGRDGPHLGTWMGPKHCKTKHMANLDGTTSDSGWDLDGPRIGPRRGSGWRPPETVTDF